MAKGSFNGVISGKKGNTVYYYLRNSNNAEKQGWREYNAKVSNPQTDGQIDQRIKLTAVNNLYRALKPIIQRGWENHKYGDESRRAFLKRALGSEFAGPYLEKGSTLAVPIEGVPITYGSLTPVVVECGPGLTVLTNVPFPDSATATTIGDLSDLFINAGLAQLGDQITFILASLNGAGTVSYLTSSFYVDSGNTDTVVDVLGFEVSQEGYDSGTVAGIDMGAAGLSSTHFAAMVTISRDGEGTNLRSYAEFDMTTDFRSYFYGSASQVQRAKASYRKKVASSTNWPLVPGSDELLPVGTTRAMVNSATPAQVQVNAYRTQGGYLQVFDNTNSIWRYVYGTGAQNLAYHKWLTSTKSGENVWSSTAPTGAQTADAIMFTTGNDSTESDLDFARWLVSDAGYDPISTLR